MLPFSIVYQGTNKAKTPIKVSAFVTLKLENKGCMGSIHMPTKLRFCSMDQNLWSTFPFPIRQPEGETMYNLTQKESKRQTGLAQKFLLDNNLPYI
jgi:hypothetical protein